MGGAVYEGPFQAKAEGGLGKPWGGVAQAKAYGCGVGALAFQGGGVLQADRPACAEHIGRKLPKAVKAAGLKFDAPSDEFVAKQ